jgi:hypothetical protein
MSPDKSKEREESSNLHCPPKKSEVIEENGYSLRNKNIVDTVDETDSDSTSQKVKRS